MKCGSNSMQTADCGYGINKCEQNCGADATCDGRNTGATCETGKTCDNSCKCVAASSGCNNNGVCDAGETIAGCPNDCSCNNNGVCESPKETNTVCPNDCGGTTGKRDDSGPATSCNVNLPYVGNEGRYATWSGLCDGAKQAGGSGIGQGCCEKACGSDEQCDEQFAGQGNCGPTCKYLLNCPNQVSSNYMNRICRDNTELSNCNWPDNAEKVEKTETSSGVWQVTFSSSSAVDVNVFVVYGRITSVTQPDWKAYAGYIKPSVCPQDSSETTCNPQLIGTHNYCSFRSGPTPLMVNNINPSVITISNPARGFWPLPLSTSTRTATITINATDEARRRNIPVVLYYQFNKAISPPNSSSWCVPGAACAPNECGTYTGCFENSIIGNVLLCVKTGDIGGLNIIPACGHYAWESQLWNKVNLLSTIQPSELSCSYCEAGTRCSCSVTGCSAGSWSIRNLTSPAPADAMSSLIPPTTVEFTPTTSGLLEVTANCITPQQFTAKVNVDVKPKFLTCPANCYTDEACTCLISNCSAGTVTAMKDGFSIKSLIIPPIISTFSFNSSTAGTVAVTGSCTSPAKTVTTSVVVTQKSVPPTTPTTIESKTCPYDCCKSVLGYKDKDCPYVNQTCNINNKCEIKLEECPDEYACCKDIPGYKDEKCANADQTCNKNKCEGGEVGGSMLTIAIIVIAALVAAYFLYFFVLKKKTKVTFDTLYRKWPARPKNY